MNLKTYLSGFMALAMLVGVDRAIADSGSGAAGSTNSATDHSVQHQTPSSQAGFNNFWGNPGDLSTASNLLKSVQSLLEVYKALTAMDERMDPNYAPPGAPDIPSECTEKGHEECKACYSDAQDKMNTTRKGLEKLRAITMYTQKVAKQGEDFISAAGGMGGTAAAVQAVATNQGVDKTVADFNAAVLSKRQELMDHVLTNLKAISACEKQFYKNDDWYNRYGFMYYQFMIAQYSNLP